MSDVIDDDLMKELGLDDDDLKEIEKNKAKKRSKTAEQSLDEEVGLNEDESGAMLDEIEESLPNSSNPMESSLKVEKQELSAPKSNSSESLESFGENLAKDVPVQLAVVIGKKTLSLGQILQMRVGEVVEFHKNPADTVDLVANGKLVAKAELVMVEGQVGVRIAKLIR